MDDAAYILGSLGGLILVFAGLHGFENKSITVISFGIGAILVIVGVCFYWQNALSKKEELTKTKEPGFSVICATLITAGVREIDRENVSRNKWVWLTTQGDDLVASPISDLLYVRFTNLDSDPMLIDFYKFEVRENGKPWAKATRIYGTRGKLVIFAGGKSVEVPFSDNQVFDRLIVIPIAPKDTIVGWIFIERPAEYIGTLEWRCVVKDIRKREWEAPVTFLEGGAETTSSAPIPIGDPVDLSSARVKFYSEVNPYGYKP
jgi:hypothetical protein